MFESRTKETLSSSSTPTCDGSDPCGEFALTGRAPRMQRVHAVAMVDFLEDFLVKILGPWFRGFRENKRIRKGEVSEEHSGASLVDRDSRLPHD